MYFLAQTVLAGESLVPLAESTQMAGTDNLQVNLTLTGAVADENNKPRDVPVALYCIDGKWTVVTPPAVAPYKLAVETMQATRERLTGILTLTQETNSWTCEVTGTIAPTEQQPNVAGANPEGLQFWTVKAEAQGVVGTVTGTYRGPRGEQPLAGRVSLVLRPGHWDMGVYENGLKLAFDMGRRRENWNHVRIAQYEFVRARDLSKHGGIRVRLTTTEPRSDVSVSVWLREEDGSWYYIKDAVPLVDGENEAVLWFADFTEAEWVAPGNHMDEDYTLDLTAISHLGIGVVNSLGVGRVRFTVTAIDLVDLDRPALPPAQLAVTGRMLSVNGHNVIPSGVFGGYAGHLPQRFRPGCQRDLAVFGLSLRQRLFLRFREEDILDAAALTAAMQADTPVARQCAQLLETANPPDARGNRRNPKLLDQLNLLLQQRELTDGPASDGTALWERNRRALETAFPGLLRVAPAEGPTEAFPIECVYDRYAAPTLVTSASWRESLHELAAGLARRSRENGYTTHFEFWNEPYLNWAERSRKALRTEFYDTTTATNGGPVRVRYKISRRDAAGKPLPDEFVVGPEIPYFQWATDGAGGLKVVDTTAFSYWSGKGLGWVYDEMLKVVGPALKTNNPAAQLIGGWDFRWNEDHWAAWDLLYKNTIDRNIQWLDGITEHHYQGDVVAMPASYEVLVAYGVTAHNKWLYVYNTECNDLVDAPARGAVDTPEKAKAASKYRKMTYNLRDCLYTALETPDKARARTVIHNDAGTTNGWTEVGYGLMRNLRGRLVETRSDDPNVWCVASVDGTDPLAMPPAGTPLTLVTCVFNDHREPRVIELNLAAPGGTEFRDGIIEQAQTDMTTFELRLAGQPVTATGTTYRVTITLPGRSAWKIALPLTSAPAAPDDIVRTQFFSAAILQPVTRGTNFATTVRLGARELATAERATLRLVMENVSADEGTVVVAGEELALPKALTADNVCRLVELPVTLANLGETVPVEFRVNNGNHAGYRVDMTSVVLTHPPVPAPTPPAPTVEATLPAEVPPARLLPWGTMVAVVAVTLFWLVIRRRFNGR